ncbi:MAG: cobalt transporter CbiM [Spirochaetaceae bacterium]|jgi:cobalt/nickel transport system permease protein|nr:cobalt transporter CbiM [Spirochaetaceae bacterium]
MHISEGVLSAPLIAAGWGIAVAGLGVGLKKTAPEKLPETALVSAALFLVSLVHVPLGPSSIHLTVLGLAGMLLGWSAVPALFVALLLQGLLLQFGGFLSLGVNTTVMGSSALAAFFVRRIFPERLYLAAAFSAGFVAVVVGSALVTLSLVLSAKDLFSTALLVFAANLLLAVVEGIITLFCAAFLKRLLPRYVSKQP